MLSTFKNKVIFIHLLTVLFVFVVVMIAVGSGLRYSGKASDVSATSPTTTPTPDTIYGQLGDFSKNTESTTSGQMPIDF